MSIELRSHFTVDLVQSTGSDEFICQAARVSTLGSASLGTEESAGLINFLMKNRHGSPFEHGSMTFRIEAPIFVWREFMRHRIGFSYNEQSGRYMEMLPIFYHPDASRPLKQVGKPGAYEFVQGEYEETVFVTNVILDASMDSWAAYQRMLGAGIAKEVARMVLPVNIYSSAYVTCNPRSLMSFLSLRTKDGLSTFPSFPQWEIEQVARLMERHFEDLFPYTSIAFDKNGRVSP